MHVKPLGHWLLHWRVDLCFRLFSIFVQYSGPVADLSPSYFSTAFFLSSTAACGIDHLSICPIYAGFRRFVITVSHIKKRTSKRKSGRMAILHKPSQNGLNIHVYATYTNYSPTTKTNLSTFLICVIPNIYIHKIQY